LTGFFEQKKNPASRQERIVMQKKLSWYQRMLPIMEFLKENPEPSAMRDHILEVLSGAARHARWEAAVYEQLAKDAKANPSYGCEHDDFSDIIAERLEWAFKYEQDVRQISLS
jgi:hypothetical protein